MQRLLQNQSSERRQDHRVSFRLDRRGEGEARSGRVRSQPNVSRVDILELCPAERGRQGSPDILDKPDGPAHAAEPRQEVDHETAALL